MPNPEPAEIPRAELTPWARDELNMGASAGADEFRRTLFQRLEKENWVPPCEAQYALETLALRSAEDRKSVVGVGGGAFFWSAEKKLREEVERFAASFFELPPPQRTAEYRKLEERCRLFPTLAHRLRGLKPGLDVVIPQVGFDRATLDLAEHLSRLFVLRPNDRAQLRRTPDERLAKTLPQWREAAARLQRQLPQVAKFDPVLIDALVAKQRPFGTQATAPVDVLFPRAPGELSVGISPSASRGYRPYKKESMSFVLVFSSLYLWGLLYWMNSDAVSFPVPASERITPAPPAHQVLRGSGVDPNIGAVPSGMRHPNPPPQPNARRSYPAITIVPNHHDLPSPYGDGPPTRVPTPGVPPPPGPRIR